MYLTVDVERKITFHWWIIILCYIIHGIYFPDFEVKVLLLVTFRKLTWNNKKKYISWTPPRPTWWWLQAFVLVSNDSKSRISHHPTHARETEDISPNLPAQYALLRRCLTQHNINLPWEKTWNKNNLILPISKLFYQPTGVSRDCHFISSSNILLSILLSNIYTSIYLAQYATVNCHFDTFV